jgi:GxxExxY protein
MRYQGPYSFGARLLEGTCEVCLVYELSKAGVQAERQMALPVIYDEVRLDAGYRLDLLVEDIVIVELKVIETLLPIHAAQVLSYLKISKRKLDYLMDFNVPQRRQGIKRVVNDLCDIPLRPSRPAVKELCPIFLKRFSR